MLVLYPATRPADDPDVDRRLDRLLYHHPAPARGFFDLLCRPVEPGGRVCRPGAVWMRWSGATGWASRSMCSTGKWITGIILRGDWGQSMEWEKPVKDLIWERIGLTMVLSASTMLFSWFIAIPVGVYSATHQYSILDYLFSFVSFVGAGTPGFPARADRHVAGHDPTRAERRRALFRRVYPGPWSWAKVVDMLKHIWIPIVDPGRGQHGGQHPHHARQPARRAAQALRDHRARQGAQGAQADLEVPGARGAEPLFQHRGLVAGQPDLGLDAGRRWCSACRPPGR